MKWEIFHIYTNLSHIWRPCIDSNRASTFNAQKGRKDIDIIVHVTSVVQPSFYEVMRIDFVRQK